MAQQLVVTSFTNRIGQVIHPGDKVLAVTHCAHWPSFNQGTYLGLINDHPHYEYPSTKGIWVDEFDQPCEWRRGAKYKHVDIVAKSTLKNDNIFKLA